MKKLMTLLISSGLLISLIFSGCSSLEVEAGDVSTTSNIPTVENVDPVCTILTTNLGTIMTTTVNTSTYTKHSTSTTSGGDLKEAPPVDWVTARTADGNGVITLVMRTYDNALILEDIEYIREYTEGLLETTYVPDHPVISFSPEASSPGDMDPKTVVYIYAAYSDGVPASFTGTAGNERSCEGCYSKGLEWFAQELAEKYHLPTSIPVP